MNDDSIVLVETEPSELPAICQLEQGDAGQFVMAYPLARHQEEFAKPTVSYLSIRSAGAMVGFVLLVLDPDGQSVELRRIVVGVPGRGIGRRALELVHDRCQREFHRSRVWLDVFETNAPARHLYQSLGYLPFGESAHQGRRLLLYEKLL